MADNLLEMIVFGRPATVNRKGPKSLKAIWQSKVFNSASAEYTGMQVKYKTTFKIFYFPHNNSYSDVDNGLKFTIDALAPVVMENDRQITRIIAERFVKEPGKSLVVPLSLAPSIAKILEIRENNSPAEYMTLIKIEKYKCNGGKLW